MSTSKFLIGAVLMAIVPLTACDKAELDATKQQLQTVSSERDALKAQLDASKQQAAALQQQVTDLQARVTAATAALAAPAADAKPDGAQGDKKDAPEARSRTWVGLGGVSCLSAGDAACYRQREGA